jgi:uncharacterized spore protein YtfJ
LFPRAIIKQLTKAVNGPTFLIRKLNKLLHLPEPLKSCIMENENFIEKLAAQFGRTASVKNVYGDPIQAGDKTIIPVAQIAFGLGGGYGQGTRKNKPPKPGETLVKEEEGAKGEGAGGGGGLYAKPKGVYEVTPAYTRFIPANNTKPLLIGLVIGFVVKSLFFSKHRKKR